MRYDALLAAFAVSALLYPLFIRYMRRFQFGQQIRDDGPRSHLRKQGTATMGGLLFLLVAITVSLFLRGSGATFWLALFLTVANSAVGLVDDYTKVIRRRSLGLRARDKLMLQAIFSLIFYMVYIELGFPSMVRIPFTSVSFDLGWFYPLLILFFLVGWANAVNLTDGLDGLAGGTAVLALMTFALIASYQGLAGLALLDSALVGALLGFLIYNIHPAKIFMGDVGSLALGAVLGANALLTKTELLLLIIGGVFLIETLSVILQVILFQLTGRRIFRMSPLHHHFELQGWTEWQVVTAFWGVGFILAIISLLELSLL